MKHNFIILLIFCSFSSIAQNGLEFSYSAGELSNSIALRYERMANEKTKILFGFRYSFNSNTKFNNNLNYYAIRNKGYGLNAIEKIGLSTAVSRNIYSFKSTTIAFNVDIDYTNLRRRFNNLFIENLDSNGTTYLRNEKYYTNRVNAIEITIGPKISSNISSSIKFNIFLGFGFIATQGYSEATNPITKITKQLYSRNLIQIIGLENPPMLRIGLNYQLKNNSTKKKK
jgi:hypothetical protein